MKLQDLKQQILSCRDCRERFGYEPQPVFQGRINSRIMQISQAPSLLVHETGRPFNDLSGKRLRQEWYHISDEEFYDPNNFYITSIARCYPGKNPSGGDRVPPKSCAKKWLHQELELIGNKMYILVGKQAADYFFPKSKFPELVFTDQSINDRPAYVLPHPSPLNVKWFKDHPEFEKERMPYVREKILNVLHNQKNA